jgi:hypothetical protein
LSRRVHDEPNDLDWSLRRVWFPEGLRPVGPRQIMSGSVRPSPYAGVGVLLSPLLSVVVGIPVLLVLVPLRFAKLVSWRIEATARPWGRRGPRAVLAWRVKGWEESRAALDELAAALARGEQSPTLAGAQRDPS